MHILIAAAALLFMAAFVLLMSAALYRPAVSKPLLKAEPVQQKELLSYEKKWVRFADDFGRYHPDCRILFQPVPLEHGVYLESRETKESGKGILLVMHSEHHLSFFLQALEKMMRQHVMPAHAVSVLLTEEDSSMAAEELAALLRKKGTRYSLCLSDESGIVRIGDGLYACIGSIRKALYQLQCTGTVPSDEKTGISGLWKGIRPLLPYRLILQILLPFTRLKGIRNLSVLIPESTDFFLSRIDVRDHTVRILAEDGEQAEEMLDGLREKIAERKGSLLLEKELPSSGAADAESVKMIRRCIRSSFENVTPLAVMSENMSAAPLEPFCRSWMDFVPDGKDISHAGSVGFYEALLKEKK